jgi:cadmium resistance transport/sequestration family protein
MLNVLSTVAAAALAFAATNIDDIFVLMLFFAALNRGFSRWQIVAGQYAGFAALVALSLVGYFARFIAPQEWIGLLGILPIIVGLKKLLELKRQEHEEARVGKAGAHAVFTVAAVTFANGGDNLGIYTPLFASLTFLELLVTLAVFFLLVAVWCALGYFLGRHPAVSKVLDKYGHILSPLVLIALGLYILIESGTFRLLF